MFLSIFSNLVTGINLYLLLRNDRTVSISINIRCKIVFSRKLKMKECKYDAYSIISIGYIYEWGNMNPFNLDCKLGPS